VRTLRTRTCSGALLLGLLASLAGCSSSELQGRVYILDVVEREDASEEEAGYLGLPLRDGQILLSEAGSPYSLFFSLCTEEYYDFTHAAILVHEDGKPFVYEMGGEYKCREYLTVDVFDPPAGVDGAKVVAWVREQFKAQPEFDAFFDYDEHEKLFCNEFVQLALEAGGAEPITELALMRQHPSLQSLLAWLKVEREWALPAGMLGSPERRVATFGQLPSRQAAIGYFAAKRELHRRFRADQKLGNMFQLEGIAELSLRYPSLRFLERATQLTHDAGKDLPFEEVQPRIQALAAEMFGEGPPEAAAVGTDREAGAPTGG
jgi:hypothetical protein